MPTGWRSGRGAPEEEARRLWRVGAWADGGLALWRSAGAEIRWRGQRTLCTRHVVFADLARSHRLTQGYVLARLESQLKNDALM